MSLNLERGTEEGEVEGFGRAVTVLGHDDIGLARAVFLVVEVRAVNQEHHVGVLFD